MVAENGSNFILIRTKTGNRQSFSGGAAFHRSGHSSQRLFIEAAFHQSAFHQIYI
jgi:hypothetical protein